MESLLDVGEYSIRLLGVFCAWGECLRALENKDFLNKSIFSTLFQLITRNLFSCNRKTMSTLPQYSQDRETRQEDLNTIIKDREILVQDAWPTRHRFVPTEEQPLHIKTARSLQIDYFRLWINWTGTTLYNKFYSKEAPLDKHQSAMWLFPQPSQENALQFPIPDSLFAQQRFCGPQTSFLTRLSVLPQWMPDSPENIKNLQDGCLFFVNYSIFAQYQLKPGCYLPKIIGVFSCSPDGTKYQTECFNMDDQVLTKESQVTTFRPFQQHRGCGNMQRRVFKSMTHWDSISSTGSVEISYSWNPLLPIFTLVFPRITLYSYSLIQYSLGMQIHASG